VAGHVAFGVLMKYLTKSHHLASSLAYHQCIADNIHDVRYYQMINDIKNKFISQDHETSQFGGKKTKISSLLISKNYMFHIITPCCSLQVSYIPENGVLSEKIELFITTAVSQKYVLHGSPSGK
jgi:hypothetical protein